MTIKMDASKTALKHKGAKAQAKTQPQPQPQPQSQSETLNLCWYCKQAVKLTPCLITNRASGKDATGTICDRCIDSLCNQNHIFSVEVIDM